MLALLALPLVAQAGTPSGRWVWGDLHAHSNWSYDGCEREDYDCHSQGDLPGAYFFENAAEEDLDFAALTDHAEASRYQPDGEEGETLYVWAGQAATVEEGLQEGVLPILGFEWSAFRDTEKNGHLRGSHRTVLLDEVTDCSSVRIAGFNLPNGGERSAVDGEGRYLQDNEPVETVEELWEALDQGATACGGLRWLSFAHHSAYEVPQATDWKLRENRPEREVLVEIYSGHGSSECRDPDARGCDWRRTDAQGYHADGAVQVALDKGYPLGFLGGTDGHDARPGSLDDGPSAVGTLDDDGNLRVLATAGGLTGVFLDEDEALSVEALFDALEARRTLATSGPRPESLRAWAEGDDGEIYLAGSVLPRRAMPATLHVEGLEAEGYRLLQVQRIGPKGLIERESEQASVEQSWDGRPGDWTYLRVRYEDEQGEEERVWISPWFVASRCGCATGTGGGLAGALAAGLLIGFRRRRR